jgi:hypothetical protein
MEDIMDQQGFRQYLEARKRSEAQIAASIRLAERFEAYVNAPSRTASAETAWEFSQQLIAEGNNTEENYFTLLRYCRFIRNDEMFVALLELVDGGEVAENLYQRVGERYGEAFRDEVFAGIGVAPYGTPTPDKPAYLQPVIQRMEARLGSAACREFLAPSLRDLPDEYYASEPEKYRQAGNIDAYLRQRKEAFMAELEACQREGRLFFSQEITAEVLAFVRNDPEMGGSKREGDIIYEVKIPYQTKQYLAETDPILKRFYACHCPWARTALLDGNVQVAETFCQCSAGFHKKAFEAVFGQTLQVDVLETVVKGDERCRFAIHLPEAALAGLD